MDIKKIIASRIKEFRKKRNMTQEQLAETANLHVTFIAHIESGKKACSIKSLQRIASALKIPVFVLLQKTDSNTKIKYDTYTEKLLSFVKDKSDSDKELLINIANSIYARDKKIYKKL